MRHHGVKNDLERSRWKLFQVGLLIATALTVSAFEWTTFKMKHRTVEYASIDEVPIEPMHIIEYVPSSQPKAKRVIPPVIEEIIEVDEFEEESKTPEPDLEKVDVIDPDDLNDFAEDFEEGTVGIGFVDTVPYASQMPYFLQCKDVHPDKREECTMRIIQEHLSREITTPRDLKSTTTLVIEFVVGTDGKVTSVRKSRSEGGETKLGERQAVRTIEGLPRFVPGKQGYQVVAVKYKIPITFRTGW